MRDDGREARGERQEVEDKGLFYFPFLIPRLWSLVSGLLVILFVTGCQLHEASPRICLGRACYDIEIAESPAAREQGLMFRDSLPPGKGMLFVFDRSGDYGFWMQNMKFSIDILWISEEKKVVHIEPDVPPCQVELCPSYSPGVPARFVLEIPAGDAARYGITQGMQVR